MSKLFLFAIGGTGARVVRSFAMMLAAGPRNFDSSLEVVPIIIDHDTGNGDLTRTKHVLDKYNEINQELYPDRGRTVYSDTFFSTRLTSLNNVGAQQPNPAEWHLMFGGVDQTGGITFAQYVGLNSMAANKVLEPSLHLMQALYDDSPQTSPNAELNLNLGVGFRGNPNIGTVVFNELKNTTMFQAFLANCNPANGDKVFIVGSIFGGTGSSGIPVIVDEIRRSTIGAVAQVPIGVALVLPYFKLQPKVDKEDTGAIDANMFNAKSIAALGAYSLGGNNSLNKKITNLYYIGDTHVDSYEYHEGRNKQVNAAHVVEWVAASAIVDFVQNNVLYGANNAKEYGVKANDGSAISLLDIQDLSKTNLVDQISSFVIAMRYYREAVCGTVKKVGNEASFYQDFNLNSNLGTSVYARIDDFITDSVWGFYKWLDELEHHAHSLKLYNLSPSGSDNMKNVLAHKLSVSSYGPNPTKYSKISGLINSYAHNNPDRTQKGFVKCLYDASVDIYNKIKK